MAAKPQIVASKSITPADLNFDGAVPHLMSNKLQNRNVLFLIQPLLVNAAAASRHALISV